MFFPKFYHLRNFQTSQFICWARVFGRMFSGVVAPVHRIRISPKRHWANGTGTVVRWWLPLNTTTKSRWQNEGVSEFYPHYLGIFTPMIWSLFQSHSSGLYLCQDVASTCARWSSRVNDGVASIASSTNPIGEARMAFQLWWFQWSLLDINQWCGMIAKRFGSLWSCLRIDFKDRLSWFLGFFGYLSPLRQVSPLQDLQVMRSAPWLMQDESRGKW